MIHLQAQSFNSYFIGRGEKGIKLNFVPSGFDIETYTQYKKDETGRVTEHFTNMYVAMFMIGEEYVECRTWEEVSEVLKEIEILYCKTSRTQFLCFIHNMSFEFSFMGKELYKLGHKIEVFAREKRKPMKMIIDDKIIFLDSAKITGFSLKKLAENYTTTQKAVGDLDYSIPRNRFTKIEGDFETGERKYIYNDVKILQEFALYYEKTYLVNKQLPMTQTMVANQYMKDIIRELKCQKEIYFLMKECFPKSREQYDYIMLFFQGAYTHGMLCNLFKPIYDCLAFDMQSQYPYVAMSKYFPMGKFRKLYSMDKILFYIENYCCLLDVRMTNVKTKYGVTILSKHKLVDVVNGVFDNGRLYSCDSLRAFITEVDLKYLSQFYEFNISFNACTYAKRGFLPDYYRLTIAELYAKKSLLKHVEGKEIEYLESKQKLNGESYGAMVTRLNFENNVFKDGQWTLEDNEIDFNKLWQYKNKCPQWGVYVTSWARYMILYEGILPIVQKDKTLYNYSDTDSIKTKFDPWILEHFNNKNKKIIAENQKFIDDLKLKERFPSVDFSTMGIFDREHDLDVFYTLGSKKYLSKEKGKEKYDTTIAGLPKGKYVEWCDKHNLDYIDNFKMGNVNICEWETGKLCAYYEDEPKDFVVTDLQGNTEHIHTESFVSLIPTSFQIKENQELIDLYNLQIQMNENKCMM